MTTLTPQCPKCNGLMVKPGGPVGVYSVPEEEFGKPVPLCHCEPPPRFQPFQKYLLVVACEDPNSKAAGNSLSRIIMPDTPNTIRSFMVVAAAPDVKIDGLDPQPGSIVYALPKFAIDMLADGRSAFCLHECYVIGGYSAEQAQTLGVKPKQDADKEYLGKIEDARRFNQLQAAALQQAEAHARANNGGLVTAR